MSAPNVQSPTLINFKSSAVAMVSGGTAFVTNAAASGQVIRVDLIQVSNISVSAIPFSIGMNKAGTGVVMVSATLAANSTVQYVGPFILEENDLISGAATDNSKLTSFISYQVLS